ncbi:MAG: double-cubane-cluster-containing anaerobic reductase [Finegoldia sp.]|nr:double-cubane-cluster-containing anaerobic reductase [Finegoldia sp.]
MTLDIKKDLPEVFEEFGEARQKAFLKVKEFKDQDIRLIGIYCTFFPQEIALAAGASVVGLCSTGEEGIADAEVDLPKNLCPLIKSSYGLAKTDKCPFFHFSDLVIGETTCDGKKKMYELMEEFKPVHIMQLPNRNDDLGLAMWEEEIRRCIAKVEEVFGVEITEEKLREAIKLQNEIRSANKELFEVMKADELPMTGMELWKVLEGEQFTFDRTQIPQMFRDLKGRVGAESQHITGRPRILVTGCPIGASTHKVIEAIENNGGIVVAFENCGGAKAKYTNVDESDPDPIHAIAKKYLSIGCACINHNQSRFDLLDVMIDDYKVDGVVDMHLQTCTPYQVEGTAIKRFCNEEKHVPYIAIDTDYSQSDLGQLNTRLGAFLEML